jgi:autotransporter-associated beta strand protein
VIDVTGSGALNFTNTGSMGFNGQGGDRNLLLTGTNSGVNIIAAAIGDFGGATSVSIDGSATWLLTGANTYTGATTVSAGVLQIGGSNLDSAIILGPHATLELNGLNARIGSLAGSGILQNNSTTAAALTMGGNNTSTTFSGVIQDGGAGALSMVKAGLGTFTLTGTNTYTGTTTISAGVLQVGSGGTTGTLGSGAVINNSSLVINRSDALSIANDFSGIGSLTQVGAGTTTLAGDSSYSGSTTINAGVLSVSVLANGGSNSNLGASTNAATNLVLNGGTLQYTGVEAGTDRLFSVGTNGGTLDASGTGTLNFTNTGSMGFNSQSGIRTLTLTGTNNGDNTLAAVIGDNGGATALTKSGLGTWVLTGNNNNSGITMISAGGLQIGAGGTTGSLGSGAVTNNSRLIINRSDAITLANEISGSGSFTQAGSGTTTLTGDNAYTGGTTINAGVLSMAVLADGGSNSHLGASDNAAPNLVLNGGTLQYNGADVSTDRLFSVGPSGGTLDASGTGAMNFTNTGSMGFNGQSGTRTLTLTGTNTGGNTLAAVIGDNGGATALTKSGAGMWVLTGANAYTGLTSISAGELQVGSGGTTGSLGTGAVINNASLTINRSDALTIANDISGSGVFVQLGSGATTLTGAIAIVAARRSAQEC